MFEKLIKSLRDLDSKKILILGTLLIIAIALPLTVYLTQREQDLRNFAEEKVDPLASNGPAKIKVSKDNLEKNFKRMTERKPLAVADIRAKDDFVEKAKSTNKSVNGDLTLFENDNVKLIYISVPPEDFMAEIKTSNFNLAKAQAEAWLRQKGLTTSGICNLPLMYYLSPDVMDQASTGTVFDPNPLACR